MAVSESRGPWGSLRACLRDCSGQTLTEYALIIVLVSVALIVSIVFMQASVANVFYGFINNSIGNIQP